MGSEPPNLQRNPNEQGAPPTHRKVRRESQEAHRHRVKGPGYGQKPLAVDIMQPRAHSRAPQSHFLRGGAFQRVLCDRRSGSHFVSWYSRHAQNEWIQVQRLDGRRFTPSGVGSR